MIMHSPGPVPAEPCDPYELVALLDERPPEPDRERRTRRFMVGAARGLLFRLPGEAARWLEVAEAYADGRAPREELLAARADASRHLGPPGADLADPEVSAVRAVLFALFAEDESHDWIDRMAFFLEFSEGAGASRGDLCLHLYAAFGDVLSAPDQPFAHPEGVDQHAM